MSKCWVENVENPLSIRIWALPEELTQGISQNVGLENVENPLYFRIWALPEELAPVNCKNRARISEKLIFMLPRVENVENPLYFRIGLCLRISPSQISKCWVELNSARNHNFDKELEFRNKLIFMLPRVENIENPLHFWISALLRSYPRHISKCCVELNSGRKHNFRWISDFENTLFSSSPGWKTLKIHFIFRSELSLI
ncbi:hypothetical protein E2320_000130 [Naja naja]|nr:hypothetical protein E2320_000130 [Naja naja]